MNNVVGIATRVQKKKPTPFAKLSKVFTEPNIPLKANQRVVALVMFQHVNMTSMQCYPSIDTIVRRAKVGRNTVCETIKLLQEIGLMTVKKQRREGKFDRNVYDFSNVRKWRDRVSG